MSLKTAHQGKNDNFDDDALHTRTTASSTLAVAIVSLPKLMRPKKYLDLETSHKRSTTWQYGVEDEHEEPVSKK